MMNTQIYQTILLEDVGNGVVHLQLNRPDKKNAMNALMIREIIEVVQSLKNETDIHLITLDGNGDFYCAGADISWVESMSTDEVEDIQRNFISLHTLLDSMYQLPQLILAKVKGGAFGGGLGLLACADFVFAAQSARFSFSEINLGLIPATISPFVLAKSPGHATTKLFFWGNVFDAATACDISLVSETFTDAELDAAFQTRLSELQTKTPSSLLAMKQLIRNIQPAPLTQRMEQNTTLLAKLIRQPETQKRLKNFIEKRRQ